MPKLDVGFRSQAPISGDLNVSWIHGSQRGRDRTDPAFQVHRYDAHTYILRQSKNDTAEAPFLYLLFGNNRAMLLDTGAGKQSPARPLRAIVDSLVREWLNDHPRDRYELVIVHTHGHNDHVAGDIQFTDRPATTVIGRELSAVQEYFGLTNWPDQTVHLDLGGRVLDVTGSPGHHQAAITLYDPWTGFLFTGDTVLPGRIYAFDYPAFLATIDRLLQFAGRRTVTYVMGAHVEMTRTPGLAYPLGSTYQPDEPRLQMTVQQLTAVGIAAQAAKTRTGGHTLDDFQIYNGPYRGYIAPLIARGLWAKIWRRQHMDPRKGKRKHPR
jgi:glyoxylase-like metal-dependent hydrolase (beta-lactamase superfamily II)